MKSGKDKPSVCIEKGQTEQVEIPNPQGVKHDYGVLSLCVHGKTVWVGIVKHRLDQLDELMLIELPEAGEKISQGSLFCCIWSLRVAVELKMPLSGQVIAVNQALEKEPELIKSDPCGLDWLIAIEIEEKPEVEKLPEGYFCGEVYSL